MDPGKLYRDFMKPLSEEIHKEINIKLSSYKKVIKKSTNISNIFQKKKI